jgi:phosphatidylserine/phosphatidylglycerophosphate/cardiolipin synthase-like enzyme
MTGARPKGYLVPRSAPVAIAGLTALLTAAAVSVTGCNLQVSAASSSASPHPTASHKASHDDAGQDKSSAGAAPGHPASASADTLVTEPEAGFSPVYRLISAAKHSVDMTMYEFADTTAEHDLGAAAARGVTVRVILDRREKSLNTRAYDYLSSHRVQVTWSSSAFEYTHQKTVVIDHAEAVIMTANLTSEYYPTSRDFLVIDRNRTDIDAIAAVFGADFGHDSVRPSDAHDLVWSPAGSQDQLLGLINGATKSLRIYSEEMGDTVIEDALIAAARRGVDVQVCGENTDGEYDSDYARLAAAGVHISYYSSEDGFYIHGKVIAADQGTSHAKAFVGSENFSSTSLNSNRELGIILTTPVILDSIASTFATDFARGKHWS